VGQHLWCSAPTVMEQSVSLFSRLQAHLSAVWLMVVEVLWGLLQCDWKAKVLSKKALHMVDCGWCGRCGLNTMFCKISRSRGGWWSGPKYVDDGTRKHTDVTDSLNRWGLLGNRCSGVSAPSHTHQTPHWTTILDSDPTTSFPPSMGRVKGSFKAERCTENTAGIRDSISKFCAQNRAMKPKLSLSHCSPLLKDFWFPCTF